jgi:hypothetical protein
VSEEDAFDIMPEALSPQPAAADDKAEDNIRGAIDTTAQKLTDGQPVSGGPSIEGYTPGLADKIADTYWASNLSGAPTSVPRRWHTAERMVETARSRDLLRTADWGKGLRWDAKPWSKNRGGALVLSTP